MDTTFSAKSLQEVMTAAEAAEIMGKSPDYSTAGLLWIQEGTARFLPTEARKARGVFGW